MRVSRRIWAGALLWTAVISASHGALNVDWSQVQNGFLPEEERKLNVAYIPVT